MKAEWSHPKLDASKTFSKSLARGKCVITTSRDNVGKAQLAFRAYVVKGNKVKKLMTVKTLVPEMKYTIEFMVEEDLIILLTYWQKVGSKWKQLDAEKIDNE
jgi:hypothetical protein